MHIKRKQNSTTTHQLGTTKMRLNRIAHLDAAMAYSARDMHAPLLFLSSTSSSSLQRNMRVQM